MVSKFVMDELEKLRVKQNDALRVGMSGSRWAQILISELKMFACQFGLIAK